MTTREEFWAELTQSYFGVNDDLGGPEVIRSKLPDAFAFLEHIYRNQPLPESVAKFAK